jgi:hypothetical protein
MPLLLAPVPQVKFRFFPKADGGRREINMPLSPDWKTDFYDWQLALSPCQHSLYLHVYGEAVWFLPWSKIFLAKMSASSADIVKHSRLPLASAGKTPDI